MTMRATRADGYLTLLRSLPIMPLLLAMAAACGSSSSTTTTSVGATPTSGGLVIVANPTPTPHATPNVQPTPTPTATPIYAIETVTPTEASTSGMIWKGTITSKTSRQYTSQGAVVNVCNTNWTTDLVFVVQANGEVSGDGTASLSEDRTCTSGAPMAPNVTGYVIGVSGQKDNAQFSLQLKVSSFKPDGTGEFGGFNELFVTASCNPIPSRRTLAIPLSDATSVTATLKFNETMTGCAGSANDVMMNTSDVMLKAAFACSDVPAGENDPEVAKLCQLAP